MGELLAVSEALVGRFVRAVNCPEWGVGAVLRVQAVVVAGRPAHRVSIQFHSGHRTLIVPPAQLTLWEGEPERTDGWIDRLGRQTLDDRLLALPDEVSDPFSSLGQRVQAFATLFAYTADNDSLDTWARRQTGVRDPLTKWTRDELQVAFQRFARARDSAFQAFAGREWKKGDKDGLLTALRGVPEPSRSLMLEICRRARSSA